MDKKTVLVTGIGGNVGQGIIRNIRKTEYPILVVGSNIENFSAGNHLCDIFYRVPYACEEDYIPAIMDIIKREKIDLIIPSTDFEIFYLAENKNVLSTEVAVSDAFTARIYLDKYLSYLHHKQYDIPFAKSCLPSEYQGQYQECIAKPRKGRGSRGLFINPSDIKQFSDDDYLIQKLFRGKEITTAFYVTKANKILGHITMERQLVNGYTNDCRVVFDYYDKLNPILDLIVQHNNIHGSANLQSIVTNDGDIIPFEVNCRISGTNSIRSNFGFEDVKYTLQEYLYNTQPDTPDIKSGVATRIVMDVIYTNVRDFNDCVNNNNNFLF
jgi:carbamoyl-phosphate synthase large subunit